MAIRVLIAEDQRLLRQCFQEVLDLEHLKDSILENLGSGLIALDEDGRAALRALLDELRADWNGRGIELVALASGDKVPADTKAKVDAAAPIAQVWPPSEERWICWPNQPEDWEA